MKVHLKLVSDQPTSAPPTRLDGPALHRLADQVTQEIQAGHSGIAHTLLAFQKLSPFAIAIIATWMTKAGMSEAEILDAVV